MTRVKASRKELIDLFFWNFCAGWERRYGRRCLWRQGRLQMTRVNELIRAVGYGPLVVALGEFFEDGNEWLKEHEHPANYFLKYPDQYVGRSNGKAAGAARKKEKGSRQAERARKDLEAFERALGAERAGAGGEDEDLRELRGEGRKLRAREGAAAKVGSAVRPQGEAR